MLEFCGIDSKYKFNINIKDSAQPRVTCTVCNKKLPVMRLLVHNNDKHNMSYSENADALEKAELVV